MGLLVLAALPLMMLGGLVLDVWTEDDSHDHDHDHNGDHHTHGAEDAPPEATDDPLV